MDRAQAIRIESAQRLTSLAGGVSLCMLSRSGASFPAVKYYEGRQAAATQLRRRLVSGGLLADRPAAAVLQETAEEWERNARDAEHRGGDWVAYAAGGVDALAEIAGSGRSD